MTAWVISLIFALLITLTLVGDLDFLVILIWPLILGTQIIFIVYWAFRLFGRKKVGTIVTLVIAGLFLLIAMQPWISDWMFNKKDAKEILSYHGFELKNDF